MEPMVVGETVASFADFLLRYFVALAAVGALAMALLELWKKLRDSRSRYHARAVSAWLGGEASQAYGELIHLTCGVSPATAAAAARTLAGDGFGGLFGVTRQPEYALFALELERMLGHIQDATDVALNNPNRYPGLYAFMTAGADPHDPAAWKTLADEIPAGESFDRREAKRRADLYARLSQVARRKLDAFQLYTGQRWVNWNQLCANVIGILVLAAALLWLNATTTGRPLGLPSLALLSLFGGILSPLAKDMVVALQQVRQRG